MAEISAQISNTINAGWLTVPNLQVGTIRPSLGTPDRYVLVSKAGKPHRRIDLFFPASENSVDTKAECWAGWTVIGYCNQVSMVADGDHSVRTIALAEPRQFGDYFLDLWSTADVLLISSGCGVTCVDVHGNVLWQNNQLGLDGTAIHSVSKNTIEGMGVWDPPGGSQPFTLNLRTGQKRPS